MSKRYLFIFLFLSTILFSKEIHFKEVKYIYALDNELYKTGTLNIDKDEIVLHYRNSTKNIVYTDTNIQIITKDALEIYTHEESVEYNLFFQLVLGIYTNNSQLLVDNFTIEKNDNTITLLPNEYLSSVIEKIEYEKNNDKLKYLKIYFVNQDRITIEEIK